MFNYNHLILLASLSASRRTILSPFFTGPLTFLVRVLELPLAVSIDTLTYVIPPLDPVFPMIYSTVAV